MNCFNTNIYIVSKSKLFLTEDGSRGPRQFSLVPKMWNYTEDNGDDYKERKTSLIIV